MTLCEITSVLQKTRCRFGMITNYESTWIVEMNNDGVLTVSPPSYRAYALRFLYYSLMLALHNTVSVSCSLLKVDIHHFQNYKLKVFTPYKHEIKHDTPSTNSVDDEKNNNNNSNDEVKTTTTTTQQQSKTATTTSITLTQPPTSETSTEQDFFNSAMKTVLQQ